MAEEAGDIVQPMEIHEMNYQSINSIKGLNNIFEEEYNSHSHLPWNEMCIYDLNWLCVLSDFLYHVGFALFAYFALFIYQTLN